MTREELKFALEKQVGYLSTLLVNDLRIGVDTEIEKDITEMLHGLRLLNAFYVCEDDFKVILDYYKRFVNAIKIKY